MSEESTSNRWRSPSRIVGTASTLIALLVLILGGGFVYNEWFDIPDVVYTILPSYKFGSLSFGGLVVENRGRATAHEVLIQTGDVQATIQQYSVDSDELWTEKSGGVQESRLSLLVDRMASGSSVTVYVLTEETGQFGEVTVTSEEGQGYPSSAPSRSQIILMIILIFVAILGLIAASVMQLWWNRQVKARNEALEDYFERTSRRIEQLETERRLLEYELEEWESGKRTQDTDDIPF